MFEIVLLIFLHLIIRQGHLPMVVLLVIHGADPSLSDAEGLEFCNFSLSFVGPNVCNL